MIVLDTNALLWLMHDSARLGPESRRLIDAATRVHYSSVSVSEIMIKHLLGRMPLPGGDRFPDVFRAAGLAELPLHSTHAAELGAFPALARHDPFDRLILAQCKAEGMHLLTSDRTLLELGESWIHDARH